jgi:acyltransferase
MKTATSRLQFFDIAKGIGILLVVLGHMIPRGMLWNIIYGCHMPLFIVISGFFEKCSFSWKRIGKLMLNYICLAAIGSIIYFLIFEFGNIYYIKQTVFNVLVGGYSPGHGIYPVEALWFIPCLVLITMIWHGIMLVKQPLIQYLLVAGLTVLGFALAHFELPISMYFNLNCSLFLLPFFFVASKCKEKLKQLCAGKSIMLLLICILLAPLYFVIAQFNGEVNIYRVIYGGSIILYYLASVLGTVLVLSLSVLILRHIPVLSTLLQLLGKHTLVMMGTHQLILLLLSQLPYMPQAHPLALFLFASSLSFGVSYLVKSIFQIFSHRRKCDA